MSVKVCFLDKALPFDGNTLKVKGIGGSETATISMSRELVKLGFDVTVLNGCDNPGMYDGVRYLSHFNDAPDEKFDIVIGCRSLHFFDPHNSYYSRIINNASYKILMLHDNIISNHSNKDLKHFLDEGYIDKVFTLSDWHTNYIMNNYAGGEEGSKQKFWQTRNGVNNYVDNLDINTKDKNLFVSSVIAFKGLYYFLDNSWDYIKSNIPDAKLLAMSGSYFKSYDKLLHQHNTIKDIGKRHAIIGAADQHWLDIRDKYGNRDDIIFTDLIKQDKLAKNLSIGSLYPYTPMTLETSCISALECINANTPMITYRYGALEETAIEECCYLMNYYEVCNEQTIDKFNKLVVSAYYDEDLKKKKMLACNAIKPYITWSSVALQWKQLFYNVMGIKMDSEEFNKVMDINKNVITMFKRRFCNPEDFGASSSNVKITTEVAKESFQKLDDYNLQSKKSHLDDLKKLLGK